MAALAVSLRLILHHHHQPGWLAVVIGLAVVCAAASVYLIYVLEILKFKGIRAIELAAAIPAPPSTRSTRRSPRTSRRASSRGAIVRAWTRPPERIDRAGSGIRRERPLA